MQTPNPAPTPAARPSNYAAQQAPPAQVAQSAPVRMPDPAPAAAPAPPPQQQQPALKERPQILRPEPQPTPPQAAQPAPAARYSGPSSGVLTWSGKLEKGATVLLDGAHASLGTLNGALPGVPVMIEVEPKDIGIAEGPSPSNGWKRLSLRSRKDKHSVITIRWKLL